MATNPKACSATNRFHRRAVLAGKAGARKRLRSGDTGATPAAIVPLRGAVYQYIKTGRLPQGAPYNQAVNHATINAAGLSLRGFGRLAGVCFQH